MAWKTVQDLSQLQAYFACVRVLLCFFIGFLLKSKTKVLLFQSALSFSQTGIRVFYYTGTPQVFNVATTGNLYFASDNLYIKIDGTTTPTTIPVNINRLVFGSSQ